MTHRFRVLALLLTATVAQVTVFDEVRVAGASVEYLLLVSVLTGYHGGPERGAVVAFFAGLLHDAVTVTPMGLHALVYPSLAVATSHLEVRLARFTRPFLGSGLAIAIAGGVLAAAAVGSLFGLRELGDPGLLRTTVVVVVMTVAVAPPTSRAVRWAVTGGLPVDVDLRGQGAEGGG
ncbi:MAG: rod shape-determining protein MreD [Actinomycetota bacterium]|nr:rod shape-determining protein MreD [Acidimicrobiales bacterium]MEE3103350.1 rod shape-determining protein MreD [Actinomycetota bacterium]